MTETVSSSPKQWNELSLKDKVFNLFAGRINRKHFLLVSLIQIGAILTLLLPLLVIREKRIALAFLIVFGIVALAAAIFSLALQVRRMHDIGYGAEWLFALLIVSVVANDFLAESENAILALFGALIGLATGLFLFVWPGSREANAYGPADQHGTLTDAAFQRRTVD